MTLKRGTRSISDVFPDLGISFQLLFSIVIALRLNSLVAFRISRISLGLDFAPRFLIVCLVRTLPSAQCISDFRFPLSIVPVWRLLFLGVTKSPVSGSFNLSQSALFGVHRVLFISFPFVHGSSIEPSFRDFVSEHPCMKSSVLAVFHLKGLLRKASPTGLAPRNLGLGLQSWGV